MTHASRRAFFSLPLAAAAAPLRDEYDPGNIKIATRLYLKSATDADLLFLKQLGLRWVHAEFGPAAPHDHIRATQERLGRFGLKIYMAVMDAYRSLKVQLGQPGRDEEIARFRTFLADLGKLGIPVAKIDFHPGNTYTTRQIETPRGYTAREFDLETFRKQEKQMFDRVYTADDIWANFKYFLDAVLPVAEASNVRLALHPDDPPLAMMNGVAKVFIDYAGIRRAEEIARGSKHFGLTFCAGTWSEGGDKMGKDVFGMIDDYGKRGKIFTVHLRNVSSPLPRFHETFHDDGYMDMYQVVKALRKVRFSGSMVPDHIPVLNGDDAFRRAGHAYTISYMRSLLRRANEEVG
jgi:mannonate dehydratase